MMETNPMIQPFTSEELLGPLNEVERRRSPKELFVAGDAQLFRMQPRVAIVGSRKASAKGIRRAERISRMLAQRGAIVVSGLAEGIDTAAHRAALAAGGRTIAVIGTPLDKSYPKSNAKLQRKLITEHAVLSQFPLGYPTQPKCFPMRNATMALLVSASVIVEADDNSGVLSHGWETLRLGRMLFIMESVANNPILRWPHEMRNYGAEVLSDRNIEQVMDALPPAELLNDALAI